MKQNFVKQADSLLSRLQSEYRQFNLEIGDLNLERLSLESQNWAGYPPAQAESLRLKRWTINDALLSLEEQRSKVEDRIKSLLRLLHQARKIESDLAEGGLYDREIEAAEEYLDDSLRRRDAALLHLKEIDRQIAVIAQAGTAQRGQPQE